MGGVLFVSYLPCVFVCPLTFFFDLFFCGPPLLFQNAQVNKSKTLSPYRRDVYDDGVELFFRPPPHYQGEAV
jgi:hypothetical protein